MIRHAILALPLAIAACSTTPQSASTPVAPTGADALVAKGITDIKTLSGQIVTDASWALQDAQAQTPPDLVASTCYQAVVTYFTAQETRLGNIPTLPSGPHVLSSFQMGRDVAKQAAAGIPQPLQIGCAALAQDVRLDVANLLLKVTGAAGLAIATGVPIAVP